MKFTNITILDENFEIQTGMDVLVDDKKGTIEKISPHDEDAELRDTDGRIYNGEGKLLMPGFVNAHAHSPMVLMRGYGEGLQLQDWLTKRIFPFEAKLTAAAVYWGTVLAMAESLKFGITSTSDMYYFCEDMIKAVTDCKCKNNISRGITNFDAPILRDTVAFKETDELLKKYHLHDDGRIRVDISIHAEYTNGEATIKQMAEYNREKLAGVHIHVSETESEHLECIERHGKTPVAYLESLGLFDGPTTAAHCVWVSDEDINILADKKVTVATNPSSNMKLASGICPAKKLLDAGVNLAIGTDSVASNNNLDFLEELKLFALASKVESRDPTAVTPKQALYAATRAGAIAQGRMDTGQVKEGNRADLIVLDLDSVNMSPVHEYINNIVYSASGSDVLLTMVDGRVLYEEGNFTTIDVELAKHKVDFHMKEILGQL